MPQAAPRVCSCGRLVKRGETCACQRQRDHARKARHDLNRPSARERGYTTKWTKRVRHISPRIPHAHDVGTKQPWWTTSSHIKATSVCSGTALTGNRCAPLAIRAASNPSKDKPMPNPRGQPTKHYITFKGETLSLRGWAARIGISYRALHNRLCGLRWPIAKAFSFRAGKLYTFEGKAKSARQWATDLNVTEATMRERLAKLRAGQITAEQGFARKPDRHITLYKYNGEIRSAQAWARALGITNNTMYQRLKRLKGCKITVEQAFASQHVPQHMTGGTPKTF